MAEDTSPPEEGKEEKEELLAGKFKSKEDLEKSYLELDKKIGEQGLELGTARKELAEAREYQMYTRPVVDLLDKDESLRKTVFTKLGITTEGEPVKESKLDDSRVQELVRKETAPLRDAQQSDAVKDFEAKHGIDKLSPEERKDQRARIGAYIGKWVGSMKNIPPQALASYLEDAYTLANADIIRNQGKLEGRVEERTKAAASIGSIPSGEGEPSKGELTGEYKEVAEKMGVDPKKYAKALEKIDSERSK